MMASSNTHHHDGSRTSAASVIELCASKQAHTSSTETHTQQLRVTVHTHRYNSQNSKLSTSGAARSAYKHKYA
jgi:hypothetical protein